MPVYGVVMGQGVSVAALGANTLYTGYMGQVGERVQTCSAVVFMNTVTGAAGLFHFPAGSINTDPDSRQVLADMRTAIAPNRAWIGYGVQAFTDVLANDQARRTSAEQHEQLRSHVLGLLPVQCRLSRIPARGGSFSLSLNHGNPVIGTADLDGVTDLRAQAAGAAAHYTVYGQDRS